MHLDFETASDLDLKTVGLYNYLRHPSTRVLLAAWTRPDGTIVQRDYMDGFDDLQRDVEASAEIHAWNAPFEWGVMLFVLGWKVPLEKMRCTMAHALYRAFPAKLSHAGEVMLDRAKMIDATRLIKVWCSGTAKAKPGDWEAFCRYNVEDVELERDIYLFMMDRGLTWPAHEREIWLASEYINWRGVPINVEDAKAARDLHNEITAVALAEIKALTGVENPNSPAQLAQWLGVTSLDKKVLPGLIAAAEGDRKRVLILRQQVALSAPKKYTVAVNQQHQGLLRNMLQYSGAGRTHRWSGRALQPHNMRRGWKDDAKIADSWGLIRLGMGDYALEKPFDDLADLIRSIITVEGRQLGVADYASIEVVMLHWAAGDKAMIDDLRQGLDAYKRYASTHFQIPIEKVDKDQRTFSKPVVLGAGYGLGAATLVTYAEGMGVTMTESEAREAIYTYRDNNKAVVRFWYGLQEAMESAIREPGKVFKYGYFAFKKIPCGACLMSLPSGSVITYWDAQLDEENRISYWGINQYTGQWSKIHTWGGKLVENAVQSISRDVLVHGLLNALKAGIDVFLHVHDEIVALLHRIEELDILQDCMTAPDWCPDAPIKAAAFSCPRYRKD